MPPQVSPEMRRLAVHLVAAGDVAHVLLLAVHHAAAKRTMGQQTVGQREGKGANGRSLLSLVAVRARAGDSLEQALGGLGLVRVALVALAARGGAAAPAAGAQHHLPLARLVGVLLHLLACNARAGQRRPGPEAAGATTPRHPPMAGCGCCGCCGCCCSCASCMAPPSPSAGTSCTVPPNPPNAEAGSCNEVIVAITLRSLACTNRLLINTTNIVIGLNIQ